MRFSSAALAALESPEQLEEAPKLVSVPVWLIVGVVTLIVAAAGVWSFFGTITTTATAHGVLTRAGGVTSLDAALTGRVTTVRAYSGLQVERDQVLYTVVDEGGERVSVRAPWRGVVLSVAVSEGKWVSPGELAVALERVSGPDDPLQVVAYVDSVTASALHEGMTVELSLPDGQPVDGDALAGAVKEIGRFPETRDSLRAFLGKARDLEPLLAAGPPRRVVIELSAESLDGTSSVAGSQADVEARFTLAEERPIAWLLR